MIRSALLLLGLATAATAAPPPHALATAELAVERYDAAQVALLAELVRFRTVHEPGIANAEHPEFRAFAEHVGRRARALGLDFTDLGAVLVVGLGDAEDRLGLVTHGDVQPADPAQWARSPFELDADSEPGRLIARGAEDDKGPIATAMHAMRALADSGRPLTRRIELIIALTEESDWAPFTDTLARWPPPPVNIVLDAQYPVVVAEKGWGGLWLRFADGAAESPDAVLPRVSGLHGGAFMSQVPGEARLRLHGADAALRVRVQARARRDASGVEYTFVDTDEGWLIDVRGRAAHSSTPEQGLNALTHLAALLAGEALHPDAAGLALDFVNARLGSGLHGEQFGAIAWADPFMGPLTVNLSTARQDDDGVELAINLRAPVGKSATQLEAELREAIAGWAVERGVAEPAVRMQLSEGYFPQRAPQVEPLLAVFRHYTGQEDAAPVSIGGGTHARVLPNAVNFGPSMPGVAYSGHSEHEFITREQMRLNLRMYTAMLAWLATEAPASGEDAGTDR